MTNFIITWSGLIFPLLGFMGVVAWRFPRSYDKLIGPIFLVFILTAFVATVAWNWGMAHSESVIDGIEDQVVKKTDYQDQPQRNYFDIEDDKEFNKAKKEYEEKYDLWQTNYSKYESAKSAIEEAQNKIDKAQLGLFEYYWFLGVFYYALLLTNIRGWFEKFEKQLIKEDSEAEDEAREDQTSPPNK